MKYREFKPHPVLRPYIDAYWVMRSEKNSPVSQRIYPDGCIDIILNLGGEFLANNGTFKMKNETAYLVGTMTRYIDITVEADTHLLGIRFKPLGFSAFYEFASLHEVTNKTIGFGSRLVPEIRQHDQNTGAILDNFFYNKLSNPNHPLSAVMETIKNKKGAIPIEQVAKLHFISHRQLERNFRRYLGISPKEYAGFIRYQSVVQLIREQTCKKSLLDLALDTGFYDHAHLTNEIKKYSGLLPSQLQNVGFLQTSNERGDVDL